MKYKVIKSFYKLSNRTGYNVGDEIELTEAEAKEKAKEGLIELKVKEVKAPKESIIAKVGDVTIEPKVK